jgi:hypothetical protein
MKRLLLILLLIPSLARANPPCQAPQINNGWASTFNNVPATLVSGFVYDLTNQIEFVTMKNKLVNWFFKVPFGNAQAWANSRTPDTFYTQSVSPAYPHGFLTEDCNEILTEDGKTYLWSQ